MNGVDAVFKNNGASSTLRAITANPVGDTTSKLTVPDVAVPRTAVLPDPLADIFQGFEKFKWASLYIHGSWADETTTPFSDIDDLIILDADAPKVAEQAKEFLAWLELSERRMLDKDPLQHHGHWLVARTALNCLNEGLMPLGVINGSIAPGGVKPVSARIDLEASRLAATKNIHLAHRHMVHCAYRYGKNRINVYELKELASAISLAPAYVFQSRGIRIGKKSAIANANRIFDDTAMKAIRWASAVRENWDGVLGTKEIRSLRILRALIGNPRNYWRAARRFSPGLRKSALPEIDVEVLEYFLDRFRSAAEHQ